MWGGCMIQVRIVRQTDNPRTSRSSSSSGLGQLASRFVFQFVLLYLLANMFNKITWIQSYQRG